MGDRFEKDVLSALTYAATSLAPNQCREWHGRSMMLRVLGVAEAAVLQLQLRQGLYC